MLHERFDGLIAVAEREMARAARVPDALDNQERKLLERDYAGHVSEGVYEREFGRIQRERAAAQQTVDDLSVSYEDARRTLDQALDLTRNIQAAYDDAGPTERRFFNQAFFERLDVLEDDIADANLAQPFRALLDDELVEALATWAGGSAEQDRASDGRPRVRERPNPRPSSGPGVRLETRWWS